MLGFPFGAEFMWLAMTPRDGEHLPVQSEISTCLSAPLSCPSANITIYVEGQPDLRSVSELTSGHTGHGFNPSMTSSVTKSSGKRTPNLWKEAYSALKDDEKGNERLSKLNEILKQEIGKPNIKIRSEDGYKQLQALINKRSQSLAASKSSDKVGKICDNMLRIEELVAAGASVGGPYVAIPAAALFLAFSVCFFIIEFHDKVLIADQVHQIYQSEKESMFELARKVAHYTVLHATGSDRIKKLPGDDHHTRDLKRNLHMLYVGLHKTLLFATAQLTISLYGDWQFVKNIMKHYDWEGQIKELDDHHQLCKDYRDEMIARQKDPSAAQPEQNVSMGPGPRNPLHWAVALGVPEQVIYLVQKNEYPINALTPRKWTAAHLAAEQGNPNIMKTLLTVPGIDLKIKNSEGHTPLHVATVENKPEAARLLLQRDSTLLGRYDHRGRTACSIAAQKGRVDILAVLRDYKQDLNEATGTNGWTALHLAAENGHVEIVKFLLAHDANKEIIIRDGNNKGLTAKEVAEQNKKLEVAAIL
jgi:hypothetical protein